MRDNYLDSLERVIENIENIYISDVKDKTIIDVKDYVTRMVKELSKSSIDQLNDLAGKEIVLLSYISDRINFYQYCKLDFREYPLLEKVAKTLIQYNKASTINGKNIKDISKIIYLLAKVENDIELRVGLAYRYLRIFIVLMIFGSFCNAAIVSDFVIRQMVKSGGE